MDPKNPEHIEASVLTLLRELKKDVDAALAAAEEEGIEVVYDPELEMFMPSKGYFAVGRFEIKVCSPR